MSAVVDTNVIVRYLTGDGPELAERAAGVLNGEEDLLLTGVVLTEVAYVLASFYRMSQETIVDALFRLMQKENLSVHALDKSLVLQALLLCRPSGRVSFADALIWAAARSAGIDAIYSFDRRFPEDGVEVHFPP